MLTLTLFVALGAASPHVEGARTLERGIKWDTKDEVWPVIVAVLDEAGADHEVSAARARVEHADALRSHEKERSAWDVCERAAASFRKRRLPIDPELARALRCMAQAAGAPARAAAAKDEAERIEWRWSAFTGPAVLAEASALLRADPAGAAKSFERSRELFRGTLGADHPALAAPILGQAATALKLGDLTVATAHLEEAERLLDGSFVPGGQRLFSVSQLMRAELARRAGDQPGAATLHDGAAIFGAADRSSWPGTSFDWPDAPEVSRAIVEAAFERGSGVAAAKLRPRERELRLLELFAFVTSASEADRGTARFAAQLGELLRVGETFTGRKASLDDAAFMKSLKQAFLVRLRQADPSRWQALVRLECQSRQTGARYSVRALALEAQSFQREQGRRPALTDLGVSLGATDFYDYSLRADGEGLVAVAVGKGEQKGDRWEASAENLAPVQLENVCAKDPDPFGGEPVPATEEAKALRAARTQLLEAMALRREGQGPFARTFVERALQTVTEAKLLETDDGSRVLAAAGMDALAFGEDATAEERIRQAIAIFRRLHGTVDASTAALLLQVSRAYLRRGDFVRAKQVAEEAREIFVRLGWVEPHYLAYCDELAGEISLAEGRPEQALVFLTSAAATLEVRHGRASTLGGVLFRQAKAHHSLGRSVLAEALTIAALACAGRRGDSAAGWTLDAQELLAVRLGERGLSFRALHELADVAREWKDASLSHPSLARTYVATAPLYRRLRMWPLSYLAWRRIAAIEELNLSHNLDRGTEEQRVLYAATLAASTREIVRFLVEDDPTSAELAHSALTTVIRRKGRVLDALSQRQARVRERLPETRRAKWDALVRAREQLARLVLQPPDGAAAERRQVEQELYLLETELSDVLPRDHGGALPITLAEVQAALPPRTALIEYFRWDGAPGGRYVAWIVSKGRALRWAVLPGTADALDAAIARFRGAVTKRSVDVKRAAREVDARMMAPLRAKLAADETSLVVSPDGQLHVLPFAALVDEKGRYLIETHGLRFVTSGRDLLWQPSGAKSEAPLLVGGVDFEGPAEAVRAGVSPEPTGLGALRFGALPGAEAEVRRLSGVLEASEGRTLMGAAATEGAIKGARSPRILHVATHGFFLEPSAGSGDGLLLSGLALAGFNARRDANGGDGVLTALELASVDLSATELVTLSACETGLGTIVNGEGVYGLRRALAIAGAKTQAITLWSVDDDATLDLMVDWYGRFQQAGAGVDPATALREVQLEFIKHGEARARGSSRGASAVDVTENGVAPSRSWSHPHYWAPLVVSSQGAAAQPPSEAVRLAWLAEEREPAFAALIEARTWAMAQVGLEGEVTWESIQAKQAALMDQVAQARAAQPGDPALLRARQHLSGLLASTPHQADVLFLAHEWMNPPPGGGDLRAESAPRGASVARQRRRAAEATLASALAGWADGTHGYLAEEWEREVRDAARALHEGARDDDEALIRFAKRHAKKLVPWLEKRRR